MARRYPWIDAYTPINEPLTTARFSGLYGLWYPHGRDALTFARCALNQLRAIRCAMRAIHAENPHAQLIQTEDLGKIFSTPRMQYQADYENERRWFTWDFLCGRVSVDHAVASHFRFLGIADDEIADFRDEPCAPDVIGVNHYVTSERFLDENCAAYTRECVGGNGRDRYADVAAVRVRPEGVSGPEAILREACERYGVPVAVTEAHLGCTRDEQLRWFKEVWDAAANLHADGLPIQAVTAWSLFGALDWNSLLTREAGHYEPGAFDLRSDPPRETAVAHSLRAAARAEDFSHPALASPGWWRRPSRLVSWVPRPTDLFVENEAQPLLIVTGRDGMGAGFTAAARDRALPFRPIAFDEIREGSAADFRGLLETLRPWAVIYAAGFLDVDFAETNPERARDELFLTPVRIAGACAARQITCVAFSSAHVFGEANGRPFSEDDPAAPSNVIGQMNLALEQAVATDALIVRTGEIFGTGSAADFVANAVWSMSDGRPVAAGSDERFSATYLPDLVHAVLDLLIDGERGVWHLAHRGSVSPAELALTAARLADLDLALVRPQLMWTLPRRAPRSRQRALTSKRGDLLPDLESAVKHYVAVALGSSEPKAHVG